MQQRLSIITLGVSDLKKAEAFYDALGWRKASDPSQEEIVAYDLHASTLALYPKEKLAADIGIPPESFTGGSITLAHNLATKAEVDATLAEAQKAGGKLLKAATDAFWGGYSGYFSDVDGHVWEVAMNPFAPLGPNGEFQWNGVKPDDA